MTAGAIGSSPPRPDGVAKATGSARYADDLVYPGMMFGATVRSPHPHARVEAVGWKDGARPGAVLVTAADVPTNGIQLLDDSWPVLADGVVRHVGEAVALVVAESRLAARAAAEEVAVAYSPLAPVLTLAEAEAAGGEPLAKVELRNDDGPLGSIEDALAAADLVVEGEYRTGLQEHIYIECQAVTAWWQDGAVTVEGSMQCPYYVHKALVHAFGLAPEKVRVRAAAVGGGFGGKEDYPSMIGAHAALLARACGRPVRIAYDRHEDIVGTTKRHPAVVRHRAGVDRAGRLRALDIEVLMDGGAYTTLSPVVLSRAALHAFGPYRCPIVRVRGRVLRTHTATNGAFRGFGAPQVEFAMERHMDRIARRLGLDPFEIRRRNVIEAGDRFPTGQTLDPSTSARECLEEAARRTDFVARWRANEERAGRETLTPALSREREREIRGTLTSEREIKGVPSPAPAGEGQGEGRTLRRGIGLSLYFHGAGFTGNGERRMRSPVTARLISDGRVEVLTAMADMGQGCAAIFPQIAAAAGGLRSEDLAFAEPDTALVPDSGPTVASRTTMIVGGLIAETVAELCRVVRDWDGGRSDSFRQAARDYVETRGPLEITRRHEPADEPGFDDKTYQGAAYPTFGWGADVVEVEVDSDTLEVRPIRVTAVCDVGRAIHPTLCKGQVEGGTLQALGWALWEEVKVEEGRYLNDRLATYIIPTIRDTPPMDVHLLDRPWEGGGPFGAKGMGELPMDGGAPAAVQAIENATGIVPDEIPATPERLLSWQRRGRRVP